MISSTRDFATELNANVASVDQSLAPRNLVTRNVSDGLPVPTVQSGTYCEDHRMPRYLDIEEIILAILYCTCDSFMLYATTVMISNDLPDMTGYPDIRDSQKQTFLHL